MTTYREWFKRFRKGDFFVEDKHGGGREKAFADAELEALLDGDPCQTQVELSQSLGVSHQAETPQSSRNDSEGGELGALRIETKRY